MDWNIPEDGQCHPWFFQGQRYVVNSEKYAWKLQADGTPGDWVGMVVPEENRIDDSIPEPEYEEDDEENKEEADE